MKRGLVVDVDDGGAVVAFDGERHLVGSAAIRSLRDELVVICFDVTEVIRRLPPGMDEVVGRVLDVQAVLRVLGFASVPASVYGLLKEQPVGPTSGPRWLEALHRVFTEVGVPRGESAAMERTYSINAIGVGLDLVRAAELADQYRMERETARCDLLRLWPTTDLVGLRSDPRFRVHVKQVFGVELQTTALGKVKGYVGQIVDARQRFLQFDAATKTIVELMQGEPRLRFRLRYAGTSTGRYSCAGAFNLHGLAKRPRPELASLVDMRSVVVPPAGRWFVARDLHAVEARVLAFLAGERALVDRFRNGDDVYSWFAGLVWPGVPIEKRGENSHLRDIGKVAVLSLGFGVGFETFAANVTDAVTEVSVTELERAYREFGRRFPAILDVHRSAADSIDDIVRSKPVQRAVCGARLAVHGDVLEVGLPSGRRLRYRGLAVSTSSRHGDGLWFSESWTRAPGVIAPEEAVPHDGSAHVFADGLSRVPLRPHRLVNNIVQAVARDICVHLENAVAAAGLPVAFSVHDSIVAQCLATEAGWHEAHSVMARVMSRVPCTLPRGLWDLPLTSDPESGVRERYA